jgi:hypothetical protein
MNNVITLVDWHDSMADEWLTIHMSPVSLYTVLKHVGCSHKWKKSVIYVPVMEHFVNSIPEHVSTPLWLISISYWRVQHTVGIWDFHSGNDLALGLLGCLAGNIDVSGGGSTSSSPEDGGNSSSKPLVTIYHTIWCYKLQDILPPSAHFWGWRQKVPLEHW